MSKEEYIAWTAQLAVERSISLDDIIDQPARVGAQGAAERAHRARRHGAVEAERVADRDRDLSDPDPVGRCELERSCTNIHPGTPSGSRPLLWSLKVREFFDLQEDPYETRNLLDGPLGGALAARLGSLDARMAGLLASH